KWIDTNHAAVELFGYETKQKLMSVPVPQLYAHPEQRKEHLELIEKQGYTKDIEIDLRKKDGSIINTLITSTAVKDEKGQVAAYQGTIKDITKIKQDQQRLRESEEKYRKLIESSREGIYIYKSDRFLFVNNSICEISGYRKHELYRIKPWHLLHPDDRERIRRIAIDREKGKGGPDVFEGKIISREGKVMECEFSVTVITYEGDYAVLGMVRDVTKQKQSERETQRIHKLESLSILAGGIAHDFNNLLTGIIGNISLARSMVNTEDKLSVILKRSEKAAGQAAALTQKLLTFSKGGSPVREEASIEEIVKDSANFVLAGSNDRCEYDIPPDLWSGEVDKSQISQVINNIILNADQSMPRGGTIYISIRNVELDNESTIPLKGGKYLRLTITDEGMGIPEDYLQKIFDPFFTTKLQGSGLGLATAYSVVNKHQGYIRVESEVGRGTTFHIYLPAKPKKTEVSDTNKEAEAVQQMQARILVMDDQEMVGDVASQMLTMAGYEVTTAADGREAVEVYQRSVERGRPYDLVILDLTVPGGMGGKQTISELKKIDPQVRAIVSSGYSDDPVMSNYKKYGFAGVVMKPFNLKKLTTIVTDMLSN
ncbi:MAG: PAS domain S-box protein, partial [Spirochaetota bacterium]